MHIFITFISMLPNVSHSVFVLCVYICIMCMWCVQVIVDQFCWVNRGSSNGLTSQVAHHELDLVYLLWNL